MLISIIVMILQVWQRWRIRPSCIKRKTRKNNEKILILCGSSWSFKTSIVLIQRHPGFYMKLLVSSICQLPFLITLSRIIYICITVTQKGKLFLLLTQYWIVLMKRWTHSDKKKKKHASASFHPVLLVERRRSVNNLCLSKAVYSKFSRIEILKINLMKVLLLKNST